MILSAYKYFSESSEGHGQRQAMTLRKQVATALGVAESTVGAIVVDWNKRNDGKFTPHMKMGRPAKKLSQDIAEVIRSLVITANTSGTPLSTVVLRRQLEESGWSSIVLYPILSLRTSTN